MNILVTGANGQLGSEMRRLGAVSPNNYIFTDVAELDITDAAAVLSMVKNSNIEIIINCAAYTNVDKAESDEATAELINSKAVKNLAVAAKETDATLFHVSTDYVFGSEGNGVGRLIKERSDFIVSIPMYGKVNSFNVSTAAAILLAQAARQHHEG